MREGQQESGLGRGFRSRPPSDLSPAGVAVVRLAPVTVSVSRSTRAPAGDRDSSCTALPLPPCCNLNRPASRMEPFLSPQVQDSVLKPSFIQILEQAAAVLQGRPKGTLTPEG